MTIAALIDELKGKGILVVNSESLEMLLAGTKLVSEKDTLISGLIRIFKFKEYFITQESTPKGEIVLRIFNTLHDAEELVKDHLEVYDRMWDGCGCKINYYS